MTKSNVSSTNKLVSDEKVPANAKADSSVKKSLKNERVTALKSKKDENRKNEKRSVSEINAPVESSSDTKKVKKSQVSTSNEVEIFEEDKEIMDSVIKNDPYLLDEIKTHMESRNIVKWTNKQRTLTFCSRGVTQHHRHLLQDFQAIMPHHISEPKWDKRLSLEHIVEAAELKNCNNVMFFEAKKYEHLYLYLVRCPDGPTAKFQVFNIHTMNETRFLGNCTKNSRPIMVFSKEFSVEPHLGLLEEMFVQIIGCPKYHPKSSPFFDHILSFFYLQGKILIRHYQIISKKLDNVIANQELREIGPRLVLEPIRIFSGCFGGATLWKNPDYKTPTALSIEAKKKLAEQAETS
uniref:Ribosome biogenesis protein BRX1 homolog n=1 Tax=Dermatophagoides pteronyssinus TaxID=6956 RepID=A0A6P6XP14_DERPT|nr:ribosome biogenesis protein BRX1-like [Dermatophagoides pteronyssinus]